MSKSILVTGASGFVGRALVAALEARGDRVVKASFRGSPSLPASADAIVHLAGENVAQRWTSAAKGRIRESRIGALEKLRAVSSPVLVSASAIGYYGDRGEELLDETAAPGSDFLAQVCVDWEKAAAGGKIFRFGLVLGRGGGALERIVPPFKMGLGGRLGNGKQWMSWIHLDDLLVILLRAIDDPSMKGIYNAVSPGAVRNEEFTAELAGALGVSARVPAPAFGLKLAFGEMSTLLLGSQHVVPERLEALGFAWRYPSIIEALRTSV